MSGAIPDIRIGEGIDRHRLVKGHPLWLGGIKIPHSHGLHGHSDGDAALHALCDALLGSLALGDLGQLFSNTDPAHAGRASADFMTEVLGRVRSGGYRVGNVDLTIMAEEPRLSPHLGAMRQVVADLLEIPLNRISIKATRGEGLGPEGRGEGITVRAVVLVIGDGNG